MIGTPVDTTIRGSRFSLSAFSSLTLVEKALLQARILSPGTWPDGARYDYVKDFHFEHYVLKGISTMEDAEALLAILDRGAARRAPFGGTCAKSVTIRSAFRNAFWQESAQCIRSAIARGRRTCCGCHETRSFAEYERARTEATRRSRQFEAVAMAA